MLAASFGPANAPEPIQTAELSGTRLLERNPYFEVTLLAWQAASPPALQSVENPHGVAISVVQGRGQWRAPQIAGILGQGAFNLGETWFWPAGLDRIEIAPSDEGLRLLVSRSRELDG
jgi:hypothetical protein